MMYPTTLPILLVRWEQLTELLPGSNGRDAQTQNKVFCEVTTKVLLCVTD